MSKKVSIKTEQNNNVCGKWIRYVRTGHYDKSHPKISQDALIARLQTRGLAMKRSALSRIETGRRTVTDVEVIYFADALHVPVMLLYEGPQKQMPTIEELSSFVADYDDSDVD